MVELAFGSNLAECLCPPPPPGTLHKCTPVLGKHHTASWEDFFRCLRMDVRKRGTYKRRQRQACTPQPDHVTTNNACTQQRPLTTPERQKQGELPTVRPGPALHSQLHPSQARRNPLGETTVRNSIKPPKAAEMLLKITQAHTQQASSPGKPSRYLAANAVFSLSLGRSAELRGLCIWMQGDLQRDTKLINHSGECGEFPPATRSPNTTPAIYSQCCHFLPVVN